MTDAPASLPAFDLDLIGGRRALRALVDEVLTCGELALDLYRQGAHRRVVTKPDRSPLTEADQAVEARLRAFVAREHPAASFLGEETGASGAAGNGVRFVVDPIDGTRAFIRGIPSWSVLVGVEWNGEPVIGVAYMPAADELFVAVRGGGAEQNGRPVRVSAVAELAHATASHGTLVQFTTTKDVNVLKLLGEQTFAQRGFPDFQGYQALLEGKVDLVIDPDMKPWDIAAASVIIREAGGFLTDDRGEHTIYGGYGVAANPTLHPKVVALIAEARGIA